MSAQPENFLLLIADDEPDIHTVTQLSLKSLRYQNRPLTFLSAASGAETVQMMKSNPLVAVILLDVVMETDTAGLDACRAIRKELGNRFVRILLRTGQPGHAPERKTIDEYDIDGYLPKAELSSTRLYSSVRTALKAWDELIELDRYRRYLAAIHECAVAMHSFDPLQATLERILHTATIICPTPLAVLLLETFDKEGSPRRCFLHLATGPDPLVAEAAADEVVSRVARQPELLSRHAATPFHKGVLVPLALHRELGHGWFYLEKAQLDELASRSLTLLAGHAANALYSTVAQEVLEARDVASPDTLAI